MKNLKIRPKLVRLNKLLKDHDNGTASLDRAEGDIARDDKNWSQAAHHYKKHLSKHSKDFAIWVQMGHALKEDSDFSGAEAAYERARSIKPKDADLLLSLGHIKKLQNDFDAAARFYSLSATLELSNSVVRELSSPAINQRLSPSAKQQFEKTTKRAFEKHCSGVSVLRVSDMLHGEGGRIDLISGDPWIEFQIDIATWGDAKAAELTLQTNTFPGAPPASSRVYVDYDGGGYRETLSVPFKIGQEGTARLVLFAPRQIKSLRWDPDDKPNQMSLHSISAAPLLTLETVFERLKAQDSKASIKHVIARTNKIFAAESITPENAIKASRGLIDTTEHTFDYEFWLDKWVNPKPSDYETMSKIMKGMKHRPFFSFVMPVYNPPVELMEECIESMLNQNYIDFEICIANDASSNPEIKKTIDRYASKYRQIKVVHRTVNGHISSASNSALSLAKGDYIVLVDHDDAVPDYCLFTVAHYINKHPGAKILYSDEDKISIDGERSSPYFKSDFNLFLMFGHNMISHLGVYDRKLVESVGGFRKGLEGSQDYDLFLRCYENISSHELIHIPHVLYHWRMIPGSTAVSADQKSYAVIAAQAAINGHFERTNTPLRSIDGFAPGVNSIAGTRDYDTSISIIIPTRNGLDDLKSCISSIEKNPHDNVEIIVVDNGSDEPATLQYLKRLSSLGIARVIEYPGEFNFSAINNFAARAATGDIICFLNNDTEVVSCRWLDRARSLLALPDVGALGARLLYPDNTIQHFGIVLGMAQHKVASTPHVGLPADAHGYFGKARLIQEFSAVTAACLFIRRADFEAVGGFDENLKVAYNDVEFCIRVREAGLKILCDPDITLIHKESKTRGSDADGEKAKRLDREAEYVRKKWSRILDADPYYSPNLSLLNNDFSLSAPPRAPMPWQVDDQRPS